MLECQTPCLGKIFPLGFLPCVAIRHEMPIKSSEAQVSGGYLVLQGAFSQDQMSSPQNMFDAVSFIGNRSARNPIFLRVLTEKIFLPSCRAVTMTVIYILRSFWSILTEKHFLPSFGFCKMTGNNFLPSNLHPLPGGAHSLCTV
jgi:hypothetical protein